MSESCTNGLCDTPASAAQRLILDGAQLIGIAQEAASHGDTVNAKRMLQLSDEKAQELTGLSTTEQKDWGKYSHPIPDLAQIHPVFDVVINPGESHNG